MDTERLKLASRVLIDAMIEELDEDDRLYEKGFADGYIAALVDFAGLSLIDGRTLMEEATRAYLKR
ncbi:hypothetical protein [Pseudomonas fluorescens]|uniref:Uncharacterized protein n=1 Tax=Pseudomonas fluorescens TaxID=294 RepID=A0A5E7EP89_PSEFL|nr:hypothetical protein [Pseudomonas fluorescens]VVO28157.1 hypothetical protein PS691_04721 [Pseudomonas fluorescens]